MPNYYHAKEGKAQSMLDGLFNYPKTWSKNQKEINEFLGFDMNKNVQANVNHLIVTRSVLEKHRPEWLPMFRKKGNPAESLVNSKVNKAWKEMTKRLGVEVVDSMDVCFTLGLYGIPGHYERVEDMYFFVTDTTLSDNVLAYGFTLMEEPAFLRMKADFLEKSKVNENE